MVERAVRRRAGEVPAEGTALMHDLIPLGPALPGALTTAEIDATMAYAEAEKALATRAGLRPATGAATSPPGAPPGAPQPCQRTWASSPPTCPASLIAAANRPPSAAEPPRSATTTRWPATSRRPTRRG